MLGCIVSVCLTSQETAKSFSNVAVTFCIPNKQFMSSSCFTQPALGIVKLLLFVVVILALVFGVSRRIL